MYAVKKQNPLSYRAVNSQNDVLADEVFCDFDVTDDMLYDQVLNTVRGKTDAEILAAKKLLKIEELKVACKAHITAGYTSNALGSMHAYDSDLGKDQSNIIGSIIAGVPLEMTCTDSNGVKAMRLHTVPQIQQVFADGMTKLQAAKARYYALKAQVESAIDAATVDAIAWTQVW